MRWEGGSTLIADRCVSKFYVTTIKASDTLEHQPKVWPVPNACARPYHPGSGSHGHALCGEGA